MNEGPALQALMQRVSKIPADFFIAPMSKMNGGGKVQEVSMPALIADLIYDMGGAFPQPDSLTSFLLNSKKDNQNYLHLVAICCYLFYFEWFLEKGINSRKVLEFLKSKKLVRLSQQIDYREFINDMERREELTRFCLMAVQLYPLGENTVLAKDRLATLDSIERQRIMKKSRKALEQARELREAMARRKAHEAASKMSRE